ncbi:MAG: WXG100 family type VII secretion target [Lachnospiraceae bacterium]|nr:WXG100 family type VII secretion target [Lachnospiraceae bacterium]
MERLVVTSPKLVSISNEFKSVAKQVKATTENMKSVVSSIESAWEGAAASAYTNQFKKLYVDMDEMYNMIMEYDKDLGEIADKYNKAEEANEKLAQNLKTDVVTL